MNDRARRESGHLMLITPERVFYAGLLGRPRQRCPGAFHVYVSLEAGLWHTHTAGGERQGARGRGGALGRPPPRPPGTRPGGAACRWPPESPWPMRGAATAWSPS